MKSHICFFLTKGGLIRKANKSELITELKSKITKNIPTHLPPTNHPRNVIMDFMAYARKVPIKMQNLKTYNNFFMSLEYNQLSFQVMQWVDIVFDLYKENNIQGSERRRRTTGEGI